VEEKRVVLILILDNLSATQSCVSHLKYCFFLCFLFEI
jgi:hypothetical protein